MSYWNEISANHDERDTVIRTRGAEDDILSLAKGLKLPEKLDCERRSEIIDNRTYSLFSQ